MDISKIAASNYKLEIVHPAKQNVKIGLIIELVDVNSDRVKGEQRRIRDKMNSKLVRGKTVKTEETESDRIEFLISAIAGWEWTPDGSFGGEKPTFTPVNARKIFDAAPWIADQCDEALAEPANFFRN